VTTPRVGDIWSHRFTGRRVRVLALWSSGRIQVKTVEPAGRDWKFKPGSRSTSIEGVQFAKSFRELLRLQSGSRNG
jgi:hypothetical protein